jgi:beta-glucosidase
MGVKHSKKASESTNRRSSNPIFHKYAEDSETSANSSRDTTNAQGTPDTEVSPPESPLAKVAALVDPNDKRANARRLAASLSLEEQAREYICPYFPSRLCG